MDTKTAVGLAAKVGRAAIISKGRLCTWADLAGQGRVFLSVAVDAPDLEPCSTGSLCKVAAAGLPLSLAEPYGENEPEDALYDVALERKPIDGVALRHMLQHSAAEPLKMASRSIDWRFGLACVCIQGGLAATSDAYRLHTYPVDAPNCLIPAHPVLTLLKPTHIAIGENILVLEQAEARLVFRITGQRAFPDVPAVMQNYGQAEPVMRVNVKDCLAALRRLESVAEPLPISKAKICRLSPGYLAAGKGARIVKETVGEALRQESEVSVQMAYLREALAGCPEKEAVLSWHVSGPEHNRDYSAIRVDSGTWQALIMPVDDPK